jgi:hypothetical protein
VFSLFNSADTPLILDLISANEDGVIRIGIGGRMGID